MRPHPGMNTLVPRFRELSSRLALRLAPASPSLHLHRGRALHEMGHLQAAYAALQSAVDLLGDSADAHFALGSTLSAMGCLPEARIALPRKMKK